MTFERFICKTGGWDLSEEQVQAWESVYQGVNVRLEVRKASLWLDANPAKRKTANGMPRFLVNWLNRCKPVVVKQEPDMYGHYPPCASWTECRDRALAEAKR